MARRKSVNEVMEQASRIFRDERFTGARWARTETAGNNYIRNMRAYMRRFGGDDNTQIARAVYMGLNNG